jgi:two-component system, cell cycle sensor histidine kinase and response regulator CckA
MRGTTQTITSKRDPANAHRAPIHEHARQHHTAKKSAAAKAGNHHQLVARATNDAVRDWDLISGALAWRQGLGSLLGYSEAKNTIAFWQQHLHPADHTRVIASLEQALKSSAENWSGEYQFQRSDGSYIQVLERAVIVRDEKGTAVRFVGTLMDVTARKQLQDQLARSQRMEAFGQLAGGMAHDFNNFLTTILGYSDLVVAEVEGRGAVAKYISEIRGAAGRAASLTQQLLAFSRRQPLELRVLEVNSLISDLERSILRLLGENISVLCELLPKTTSAYIKVDPNQFTQIIVNLAVNARDAMSAGGRLTLKTRRLEVNEAAPDALAPELAPGSYVVISVIDNGCGMTDDVKARLFEPFFTTKKDDPHGSGLGLAACYGIVRQSGGHIALESTLGKGTAVHIYLPEVPAPKPGAYQKPRTSHLPTGTETVLMLEDDISVRHVMVRNLRRLGYEVIEAVRAGEARQRMSEQRVDLVVSDIVLPDMSGRDFARWAEQHHPQTRVLLTSGYLASASDTQPREGVFLAKPFDPEQLARAVRDALDATPG